MLATATAKIDAYPGIEDAAEAPCFRFAERVAEPLVRASAHAAPWGWRQTGAAMLVAAILGVDLATPASMPLGSLHCLAMALGALGMPGRVVRGWTLFSLSAAAAPLLLALGTRHSAPLLVYNLVVAAAMIVAAAILIARANASRFAPATRTARPGIEAVGELSTIIAHEINQPLAAVAAFTQAGMRWLDRDQPDIGEARRALGRATDAALYAADVIERVRSLTSQGQSGAVRIETVAASAAEMVAHDAALRGVRLTIALEAPGAVATGDPVLLQQAIVNLLNNAIQAVQDRDIRSVTLHTAHLDDAVLIEVRDSGPGFAPEARERAFTPYFTTRPRGTGLGLSICRSVAELFDGTIEIGDAGPEGGARVSLRLPLFRYTIV